MSRPDETSKTVLQLCAFALGFLILAMIAHKAHADISLIAAKYSGGDFWRELARYLIGNLAGGGKVPASE